MACSPTIAAATGLRADMIADDVVASALRLCGLGPFDDLGSLAGYAEGHAEASLEHCPDFRADLEARGRAALVEHMQRALAAKLKRSACGPEVTSALDSSGFADGRYAG